MKQTEAISKHDLEKYLGFAIDMAKAAGAHTAKYFQKSIEVESKQDESPVTIADRETELLCRKKINENWPNHGIVGEEYGNEADKGSGLVWTIDPIDGTKSFISGLPLYTVLISLMQGSESVLGVIYQPILNEMVYAAKGLGAFYNDGPAKVRQCSKLSEAWLMCTDPTHLLDEHPEAGTKLLSSVKLSRTWGDGYGYLMVASGRADIMVDPKMHLWDVAALKPVIEEAGGAFSDLAGRNQLGTSCVVASKKLHSEVLKFFKTARG